MTNREFDISDILSVSTGILVSTRGMEGIQDILRYMTGEDIFTHDIPRAIRTCAPWLREQLPWLCDEHVREGALAAAEAEMARARRGSTHPVQPLPSGVWESRNPIEELERMMGDRP